MKMFGALYLCVGCVGEGGGGGGLNLVCLLADICTMKYSRLFKKNLNQCYS